MSQPKNLAAWTELGSCYPQFLSLNEVAPDQVQLICRGPSQGAGCGSIVTVTLSKRELAELAAAALSSLGADQASEPRQLVAALRVAPR